MEQQSIIEKKLKNLQLLVGIVLVVLLFNTILLCIALKDPSESTTTTSNNSDSTETYEYDVSMFNEVDLDEYKEELNKDELNVVYIGRSTCGYCVQFLPILQQAQADYNYTTLYVDTDKISNDDLTAILDTMEIDISTFGTPTTAILKNGEVIDVQIGYVDYSSFVSMLEENGFTK